MSESFWQKGRLGSDLAVKKYSPRSPRYARTWGVEWLCSQGSPRRLGQPGWSLPRLRRCYQAALLCGIGSPFRLLAPANEILFGLIPIYEQFRCVHPACFRL